MTPTKSGTAAKAGKYIRAIGRRKTAVASVRLFEAAKNSYTVNGREFHVYFPTETLRATASAPIAKNDLPIKFQVQAMISGGGISAQAGALRHALARALIQHDGELRKKLKKEGFLERDARAKERRKFGLKKARKAPQWSKR